MSKQESVNTQNLGAKVYVQKEDSLAQIKKSASFFFCFFKISFPSKKKEKHKSKQKLKEKEKRREKEKKKDRWVRFIIKGKWN